MDNAPRPAAGVFSLNCLHRNWPKPCHPVVTPRVGLPETCSPAPPRQRLDAPRARTSACRCRFVRLAIQYPIPGTHRASTRMTIVPPGAQPLRKIPPPPAARLLHELKDTCADDLVKNRGSSCTVMRSPQQGLYLQSLPDRIRSSPGSISQRRDPPPPASTSACV